MINNKIIMLFLLLPLYGYGHQVDRDQDFTAEHTDQTTGLVETPGEVFVPIYTRGNKSRFTRKDEKLLKNAFALPNKQEEENLLEKAFALPENKCKEEQEKIIAQSNELSDVSVETLPLIDKSDPQKHSSISTGSRHYSEVDMQLLEKINASDDAVCPQKYQLEKEELAEKDLIALKEAFSRSEAVKLNRTGSIAVRDDITGDILGEYDCVRKNDNKAMLELLLHRYSYGIGFGLGIGATLAIFYAMNKLYQKYGDQWKAKFKQLMRFCKNKSCRHKKMVDII